MAEVARMLTVEDTGKGFGAQDLGFIRWKEKKWGWEGELEKGGCWKRESQRMPESYLNI